MDEYLKRDDVVNNNEIITVHTKEYGDIEVVPVEYLANLPIFKFKDSKIKKFVSSIVDKFEIKSSVGVYRCKYCSHILTLDPDEFKEYVFCPYCGN